MSYPPFPLYWDANLLVSYLEGTPGRFDAVRDILIDARGGNFRICTSVISVAEVAFVGAERTFGVLDPAIARALDTLWADGTIELINLSVPVALTARDLVRTSLLNGPRLKPADAIHLATAQLARASVFHTYDLALHRHSGRYGFAIAEP